MSDDLKEIEAQIAEAARKSRLARKISAWAPVAVKAVVALWMIAVLYELHETRRYVEYTSGNTSVSSYSLEQLRRTLAPTHRY